MKLDHSYNDTQRRFACSYLVFTVEPMRVDSYSGRPMITANVTYADGPKTFRWLDELQKESVPATPPLRLGE